jgi:DNA-binding transcriptional regulator YbjK
MAGKRLSTKAQMTRSSLVTAAALILREEGPAAVTYRNVAKKAGAASSAVGYYFDSIDEVLKEAAEFNMREWAERAEKAADVAEAMTPEMARDQVVGLLLRACLPEAFDVPAAHYEQLIMAAQSKVVTAVYRRGRVRLSEANARILKRAGFPEVDPSVVSALVDGAAVAGISEGNPVREEARRVLTDAFDLLRAAQAR